MRKFKNLSKKSRIILIIALVTVVCFMIVAGIQYYIASKILSKCYEPDLIISSPDGQYELVICEWFYTVGGGSEIYIRKPGQDKWYNSWMKTKIGTTSAETLSFAQGQYYVEWESDKVTIYYYQGVPAENANDRTTWGGMVSYGFGTLDGSTTGRFSCLPVPLISLEMNRRLL